MKKTNIKATYTVNMQSIYGKSAKTLFSEFINIVEKEVLALKKEKLSNRVFFNFINRKENLKQIQYLKSKLISLDKGVENRKIIFETFHNIFRHYRWADESGDEKDIEIKVWISNSLDKLEQTIKLLERK